MSDLRESGAIEQDADCVWMLWRKPSEGDRLMTEPIMLVIPKNRNGPTGEFPLDFHRPSTKFSETTPEHVAESYVPF